MLRELRDALLRWYDRSARDLPWRRTRDPYAIWVSEVMLQQTRVETVIPYFERFMARFPTPAALAEADEDAVLAAFSGLGYYRRARLLHAGVRDVVARYGGQVPEDAEERRSLPGIGRYTAGAIGSIAFDRPEPLVDGNVARVMARVLGIDTPLGAAATEKRLWAEAEKLVVGERPGDLNQALMELGATVCTPKSPRCEACPIEARCEARRTGRVETLPVPKTRRDPTKVRLAAVVAFEDGRFWLVRSADGLFRGLFGLPMATSVLPDEALRDAGITASTIDGPVSEVSHVLSHRHLTVEVHRARGAKAEVSRDRRCVDTKELETLGVSTLTRKLLHAAGVANALPARLYERSSSGRVGEGTSKVGPRSTVVAELSSKNSSRRRSKSTTPKQG